MKEGEKGGGSEAKAHCGFKIHSTPELGMSCINTHHIDQGIMDMDITEQKTLL